jgi:hypothetical protein
MPATTDAKTIAIGMLKSSYRLLSKDLEALPDDAYCQSFGPKCRTVADLIYELNTVNEHIRLTIAGAELFAFPDGWITAPADFNTKEKVIVGFNEAFGKFIATAEGFTEEEMLAPFMDEGSETNRFERCRFVAVHNWYHSGQLNFIQTLRGDDVFHWAS